MNKIILIAVALLTVFVASCSKGYDQTKVDNIDKESPDVKVMIEQANYALDDAEKAPVLEKWVKENEEEAMSLITMCFAIDVMDDAGEIPEKYKEDVRKLTKRYNKIKDDLTFGSLEVSNSKEVMDDAPDFHEDDDNYLNYTTEPVEAAGAYSVEGER